MTCQMGREFPPGSANSKCKGPGVGMHLANPRNTRPLWQNTVKKEGKKEEAEDEIREEAETRLAFF